MHEANTVQFWVSFASEFLLSRVLSRKLKYSYAYTKLGVNGRIILEWMFMGWMDLAQD